MGRVCRAKRPRVALDRAGGAPYVSTVNIRFDRDQRRMERSSAAQIAPGAVAVKRKLTTIFCADAVRFGALMEADEDATLGRLRRYRAVMGELFDRHEGRSVNTWGDAVIAEFPSVVEAVRCAVEIQEAVEAENAALAAAERMQFRIGINLGDVMDDDGDLYGDGVNVAARLQALADPGGVLVSRTVYEMAHKQLALGFDPMGEQAMKSISEPVSCYRVRLTRRNAPEEAGTDAPGRADAPADAPPDNAFADLAFRANASLAWLRAQPPAVRRSAMFIGAFFALNVLFGGIANPWFIFPSLPFAFHLWRHWRRQRRAMGDGGLR